MEKNNAKMLSNFFCIHNRLNCLFHFTIIRTQNSCATNCINRMQSKFGAVVAVFVAYEFFVCTLYSLVLTVTTLYDSTRITRINSCLHRPYVDVVYFYATAQPIVVSSSLCYGAIVQRDVQVRCAPSRCCGVPGTGYSHYAQKIRFRNSLNLSG